MRIAIRDYFDALYDGDVALFRSLFHPEARLYSSTGGKLVSLSVDDYMSIVSNRPSAKSRGDRRQDEVVDVVVSSPTTAHARVKDVYLPKHFVDELTFLLLDGRWRLVAKAWHFELE